jgi:hypothetical protein
MLATLILLATLSMITGMRGKASIADQEFPKNIQQTLK